MRLAQLSSALVSRSQAKWVMNRATQFKTVILDFEGVVHVGQAFVDEVFRVFATLRWTIESGIVRYYQSIPNWRLSWLLLLFDL